MAKKRVHEIAKDRGMPSKEVIAILQKAGLDVKTAAQSIDENDIAMAFSNGGQQPAEGQQPNASAQTADRRPQEQAPQPSQQRPQRPERPTRPTRGVPPTRGDGGGGAAGRRRRVVIDS